MIGIQIALAKSDISSAWWDKQDKEKKAAYIKKHPNSKYARQATKDKLKEAEKKAPTKEGKEAVKKVNKSIPKPEKTKVHKKVKAKWHKLSKDHRKMFDREEQKDGSKERRTFGKFMKDKAKGVGKAVRHEVKEWKDAGKGLKKLATGKKMTAHEKHALKTVAIHTAMVVGPMAISGGLSGGLAAAGKGMAVHMLEHTAIIRGAQIAMFAGKDAKPDASAIEIANMNEADVIDELVKQMGDAMITMKTKDEDWLEAVT